MSFSRYLYDECRTKKQLQESTGPGRWVLNQPGQGSTPYYIQDPHIRLQQWGANVMTTPSKHPIDIASDLDGRTRPLSRNCSQMEYPNYGVAKSQKQQFPNYTNTITSESRTTNPAWMYRDLEQTRWEYPLMNPQENTCMPFHNNLSSRILEKNSFVPKIPTPMCD